MPPVTHRAWVGLCPVYVGDLEAAIPFVVARHSWLEWLLDACEAGYFAASSLRMAFNRDLGPLGIHLSFLSEMDPADSRRITAELMGEGA